MRVRPNYSLNAGAYGAPVVSNVNVSTNPTSYKLSPFDAIVLVDVSGYSAAGPTIQWHGAPEDDFPVMIRNIAGSVAAHNITILPPAGWTIEDPSAAGTFVSSLTLGATAGFEAGIWAPDRKNRRLVLDPPTGAGASGGGPTMNFEVFVANGTFLVPAGVNGILIDTAPNGGGGGGGSAGGGTSPSQPGGGGGGGGRRTMMIAGTTPGDTLTIAGLTSHGGGGGAGGIATGTGNGANGTAGADITVTNGASAVVARFVGGSGGAGGLIGITTLALTPGGQDTNNNGTIAGWGLYSLGGANVILGGGSGFGGFGGGYQNPGGLNNGLAGGSGYTAVLSTTTTAAPATGGAAGTQDGTASGGSGGGGGGTGGYGIGGNGGNGSSSAGGVGGTGINAAANTGAGGGGGGAGSGSDTSAGNGGRGGNGAAGVVLIGWVA